MSLLGIVKTRTLLFMYFMMAILYETFTFKIFLIDSNQATPKALQTKAENDGPVYKTLASLAKPSKKDLVVARRLDDSLSETLDDVVVAKQESSLRYCIAEESDDLNAARKRLELLHIPKTGGRALESLAAKKQIRWGACHWVSSIHVGKWISCPKPRPEPKPDQSHPDTDTSNWHVPIVPYFNNLTMYNPYMNATIFMVVRDPFSRAVSEATFKELEKGKPCASNATWLNEAIAKHLKRAKTDPHKSDSHWVPQHEYLRIPRNDDEDKPYVLKFESLKRDFACLMKKYGLDLSLGDQQPKESSNTTKGGGEKLTRANLTEKSKSLIRAFYAKDFEMFGYATDF
jgi:hypothetical protein